MVKWRRVVWLPTNISTKTSVYRIKIFFLTSVQIHINFLTTSALSIKKSKLIKLYLIIQFVLNSRHTLSRLQKTLSVNDVLGNNYCLYWNPHVTNIHCVGSFLMSNFVVQYIKKPSGLEGCHQHEWPTFTLRMISRWRIHTCHHNLYFATRNYVRKHCAVIHQQLPIFECISTECLIPKLDTLWKQS